MLRVDVMTAVKATPAVIVYIVLSTSLLLWIHCLLPVQPWSGLTSKLWVDLLVDIYFANLVR